jgi:hypothetical protein
MDTLQHLLVFVIVAGAVLFLARRVFLNRERRRRPAQTFVPLSSLKKPRDGGCH